MLGIDWNRHLIKEKSEPIELVNRNPKRDEIIRRAEAISGGYYNTKETEKDSNKITLKLINSGNNSYLEVFYTKDKMSVRYSENDFNKYLYLNGRSPKSLENFLSILGQMEAFNQRIAIARKVLTVGELRTSRYWITPVDGFVAVHEPPKTEDSYSITCYLGRLDENGFPEFFEGLALKDKGEWRYFGKRDGQFDSRWRPLIPLEYIKKPDLPNYAGISPRLMWIENILNE